MLIRVHASTPPADLEAIERIVQARVYDAVRNATSEIERLRQERDTVSLRLENALIVGSAQRCRAEAAEATNADLTRRLAPFAELGRVVSEPLWAAVSDDRVIVLSGGKWGVTVGALRAAFLAGPRVETEEEASHVR